MSDVLEKDLQVAKHELMKTQRMLMAYWKTVNQIDDYFEYSNESQQDKRFIIDVLTQLRRKLKKIGEGVI